VNDRWAAAVKLPSAGAAVTVDAREAGQDPSEPVPSCGTTQLRNAVWYRIAAPATGTHATFTATGRTGGTVLAVYAVMPNAGTELACVTAPAGVTARLEHVLAAKLTFYVGVGSAPGAGPAAPALAGDVFDVRVSAARTPWRAILPLAARRQGVQAAGTPRELLSFGGLQTSFQPGAETGFHSQAVNRLDLRTGKWSVVAQLPIGLSYGAAVRLGARIFLPGGQSNPVNGANCVVNTTLSYDVTKRRFTEVDPISGPPHWDYAAAPDASRGLFYRVGGAWDPTPCDTPSGGADVQISNRLSAYQPGGRRWLELVPMTVPRRGPSAQVLGGKLVVTGGLGAAGAVDTTEIFDPATGRWALGPAMPVPVYGAASGVGYAADGRELMYVAGGWTHGSGGTDVGITQILDLRAGRWTTLAGRATPRDALAGAVAGGMLFSVAGHGPQPLRAVERLKVDLAPPRVRVRRQGDRVVARASDPSTVTRIEWRLGRSVLGRGARLPIAAARPGMRVHVWDAAGNVAVVKLTAAPA